MKKTTKFLCSLALCLIAVVCHTSHAQAINALSGNVITFTESLKQIDATENTVTISWAPLDGADSYAIKKHIAPDKPDQYLTTVTDTTATITLEQNTSATLRVVPLKNGQETDDSILFSTSLTVYTIPAPLSGVKIINNFNTDTAPELNWEEIKFGGIEGTVYDHKGNLLNHGTSNSSWPYLTVSSLKGKMGYVVLKTYVDINNVKYYSKEAVTVHLVPQPAVTKFKVYPKKASVKWQKVKGARKYFIYACKGDPFKKYKKIATVSSSKNSYTFKKWNKKAIDTRKNTYYLKVIAVGTFGKKSVKSTNESYIRIHSPY